MNETNIICTNTNNINNGLEFLNNSYEKQMTLSRGSSSSGSSCHSDTSEDNEITIKNGNDEATIQDDNCENKPKRKFRSMSDGAANQLSTEESPFEVFPSLPDSVLQKMELFGDVSRDRLSEDEIEQKFVALALAFTIDAATIKDRCERQRRYRDQTETNLSVEIDKLIEKINGIQPLCVDAETTELLTSLLSQVDVIMRASSLAAISAERYGAVQHEERLAESVNLMINHVTILKQQRDAARRHLQYTKRVLQDTNSSESKSTQRSIMMNSNVRTLNRRRASIATITEPKDPMKPNPDNRRILRRTSDLSIRASALTRTSRLTRLELGVDLVKIREGINETEFSSIITNENDNQSIKCEELTTNSSLDETSQTPEIDIRQLSLGKRILYKTNRLKQSTEYHINRLSEDGTLHEIFCFASLMCFSFSLMMMANLLIEMEYAKRGIYSERWFFHWSP